MGEDRFDALAVRLAAENAAAAGRAHRDRRPELAARAVAQPRRRRDQLVGRGEDVIGELDLDDRAQPIGAHADRDRQHAALGDRRIEDALVAVLFLQALGHPEDAAIKPDILAEDDDVGVAREHHVHRRIERLHHRHRRHGSAPLMSVTPAKAGAQGNRSTLAPLDSRFRGNDGRLDSASHTPSSWRWRRRCQGISLKTSSNIVLALKCGPWSSVPWRSASRAASRTSSASSLASWAWRSGDHSPRCDRWRDSRSIGSPSGHSLASSSGR